MEEGDKSSKGITFMDSEHLSSFLRYRVTVGVSAYIESTGNFFSSQNR